MDSMAPCNLPDNGLLQRTPKFCIDTVRNRKYHIPQSTMTRWCSAIDQYIKLGGKNLSHDDPILLSETYRILKDLSSNLDSSDDSNGQDSSTSEGKKGLLQRIIEMWWTPKEQRSRDAPEASHYASLINNSEFQQTLDNCLLGDITSIAHNVQLSISNRKKKDVAALFDNEEHRTKLESFLDLIESIAEKIADITLFAKQVTADASPSPCSEIQDEETARRLFRNKLYRWSAYMRIRFGELPLSLYLRDVTLEEGEPVDGGGYGDVYKGKNEQGIVAIKKMRMYGPDAKKARPDLLREGMIWQRLNHPNIVPFLGMYKFSPEIDGLVSRWMEKRNINQFRQERGGKLSESKTKQFLADIASGLAYLHDQEVVHGDLRGSNILIDEEGRARLVDFGLSTWSETTSWVQSNRTSAAKAYIAPELHAPKNYQLAQAKRTSQSDIYAFGCVCWEIYVGSAPFTNPEDPQACDPTEYEIIQHVVEGRRPLRDTAASMAIPDSHWEMMQQCWNGLPEVRPSADTLKAFFRYDDIN